MSATIVVGVEAFFIVNDVSSVGETLGIGSGLSNKDGTCARTGDSAVAIDSCVFVAKEESSPILFSEAGGSRTGRGLSAKLGGNLGKVRSLSDSTASGGNGGG